MADLETIAVTCASLICGYYGALGLTIVCTSDCSAATEEEGGETVSISPLTATLYCILALAAGWLLWMMRDVMRNARVGANLKTFAATAGHATAQGVAWHALAMRYGIISFCLFSLVIGWTQLKLIVPLRKSCQDLPPSQVGGFIWSMRKFLESLEWLVFIVLGLFVLGFVFAYTQRNQFEHAATQLGYGAQKGVGLGQSVNSLFGGTVPTYNAIQQGGGPPPLEVLQAQGSRELRPDHEALAQQHQQLMQHLQEQAHHQQHVNNNLIANLQHLHATVAGSHPGVTPVTAPGTPGHAAGASPFAHVWTPNAAGASTFAHFGTPSAAGASTFSPTSPGAHTNGAANTWSSIHAHS